MALFGIGGVDMTRSAFVEINGSLKAGHASHSECLDVDSPLSEFLHYHREERRT